LDPEIAAEREAAALNEELKKERKRKLREEQGTSRARMSAEYLMEGQEEDRCALL
jgi:hypothetical protein